jgi:uncharacterized BrkB/YihY/UPF0761 family membrane protein
MKAIHSSIGFLVVFAIAYCVPMVYDQLALKFYFLSSQFRFSVIPEVRIKFATVAVVAMLCGVLGAILFRYIPRRLSWLVHMIGLVAIIAAAALMINKEAGDWLF